MACSRSCWLAAGGADDAQARVQRELDEDRPDAAGGAEHDDRRAGRGVQAPQHPQGGEPVDDDGLGLRRAELVGDRERSAAGRTTCSAQPPVRVRAATR